MTDDLETLRKAIDAAADAWPLHGCPEEGEADFDDICDRYRVCAADLADEIWRRKAGNPA